MRYIGTKWQNIRYITTLWQNVGDKLIYLGVKDRYPGGSPCFYYSPIPDVREEIIVAGTPWLWDLCVPSKKYKYLAEIKNKKRKALGVGSCYPLSWVDNLDAILQHNNKSLTNFWKPFGLITVRDRLAKQIFDAIGVKSVLEPCPSSTVNFGIEPQEGEYDLYFIYDAITGVSRTCINLEYWEEVTRSVVEENPGIRIVANCQPDLEYAHQLGYDAEYVGEHSPYRDMSLNSAENMLRLISKARKVISGRIHAAVPAIMFGKETYILPVDSRYLTCELLGGSYKGIWPGLDLERLKNK